MDTIDNAGVNTWVSEWAVVVQALKRANDLILEIVPSIHHSIEWFVQDPDILFAWVKSRGSNSCLWWLYICYKTCQGIEVCGNNVSSPQIIAFGGSDSNGYPKGLYANDRGISFIKIQARNLVETSNNNACLAFDNNFSCIVLVCIYPFAVDNMGICQFLNPLEDITLQKYVKLGIH